jgi:hypothetical protein
MLKFQFLKINLWIRMNEIFSAAAAADDDDHRTMSRYSRNVTVCFLLKMSVFVVKNVTTKGRKALISSF